jgi:hypothetical protein
MKTHSKLFIIFVISLSVAIPAHSFTLGEGTITSRQSKSNTTAKLRTSQSSFTSDFHVINIIIDKIDDHAVYTKDGKSYLILSSTRITNNHNPDIKVSIGELMFKDGELAAIIIK